MAGAKDGHGKKAVVVGSCNSAHDMAQDLLEKGHDVTVVQRSSTLALKRAFVSAEKPDGCGLGGE